MLPSTSELIKKYGLDAKKSLGQNFILDKNFTDKIAKAAGDLSDYEILEIGPGPGSLTRSILDNGAKKLIVIEKDERCLAALYELQKFYGSRLEIINADALEIDEKILFTSGCRAQSYDQNKKKFKIIANLPYNIGTVLLVKWLKISSQIESMTLMLQKEVVERIVAKKGDKHYGRLAIMTAHLADAKLLFTVNRNVFNPPPKVTSAIVHIIPRHDNVDSVEFEKLEKIVAKAFSQRRKMIKSALKGYYFNNIDLALALQKAQIAETLRAEEITVAQFCNLAKLS